jgi:hypothetical protein
VDKNRTAYKNQYLEDNYDRIYLTVPKGQKEVIAKRAKQKNLSITKYINNLIEGDLKEA